MCLIDDNRKALASSIINLFIDDGELLQSRDDDSFACINSILKVLRGLLVVDSLDTTKHVVKTSNRILQLGIQIAAIRNNDDRCEDRLILFAMK